VDPPDHDSGSDFLQQVLEKVARVFYILNTINLISETERDTALALIRIVMDENFGILPDGQISPVSAKPDTYGTIER